MEESVLIDAVRAEVGKVTSTSGELPDVDIQRQYPWILDIIADRITIKKLRSFTTVKNQRRYSVSTSTRRVSKVYPPGTIDEEILDLGDRIVRDFAEGNEYYNFPSMWYIKMARKVRGRSRFKWSFDAIEREILVDPKPDEAGDTYWYVSIEKSKWTLTNLPSDFEYLVVVGTAWKALEQIALRRNSLGGIQRSGGMVDYPASSLNSYIERKKSDFFTELNTKALLYR